MKHEFLHNFLTDLKVELLDEFDRNFERKGFFGEKWKEARYPARRGSLMMRTGALRRSIRGSVAGNVIRFSSSLPYASIHNEGGMITVTSKMKRYFWAMHLKAKGSGKKSLSAEASFWKAMALKKVGSKIRIDQRQFIGPHREVDLCVERVLEKNMKEFERFIHQKLKQ